MPFIAVEPLSNPGHAKFILNSWINSLRYVHPWSKLDRNWLSTAAHALITRLLTSPLCTTLVAVNKEDPDQVFGFVVFSREPSMLHWIYVKRDFREMGFATALMTHAFIQPTDVVIEATHKTHNLEHLARWNIVHRSRGLMEVTL